MKVLLLVFVIISLGKCSTPYEECAEMCGEVGVRSFSTNIPASCEATLCECNEES